MDHVEKVSTRQSIEQAVMTGETVLAHRARLQKLLRSPYFGRCDFRPDGRAQPAAIYVGVHHFNGESGDATLVYDWRAPIATLFYDHETGPAHYESPSGDVYGEILLKRTRGARDGRTGVFSALEDIDGEGTPLLDRFSGQGRWVQPPAMWQEQDPEDLLLRQETVHCRSGSHRQAPTGPARRGDAQGRAGRRGTGNL